MTVGELHRALENVSDTREVCFRINTPWIQKANYAGTKQVRVGSQEGYYFDLEAEPDSRRPRQLIFVIE